MRKTYLAVLAAVIVLATPAQALQRFAVAAGNKLTVEDLILLSAKDRGLFEKEGIDLVYVPSGGNDNMPQRLENNDIDAHVHLSSAWKSRQEHLTCSTMVFPFARRYFSGVIATTDQWNKVQTIVVTRTGSLTHRILDEVFKKNGVDTKKLRVEPAGAMGVARISRMFASEKPAATVASDPDFEYLRRLKGVHVLSDIPFPIVGAGLFVRCSDLTNQKRRALIETVVRVLTNEMAWILDVKVSDPILLPWLRRVVAQEENNLRSLYVDQEARPATEDPAHAVLSRFRALMSVTPPSKSDMEYTARFVLESVPDSFSDYYDFSMMSHR